MSPNKPFTEVDVAVVGAGLGGLSTAIALAQQGKSVALFEANALGKQKVCGEFISPESRAIFERLGVLEELDRAGARAIQSARILTSRRVGRRIPFRHTGIGISRALSDTILWEHATQIGVAGYAQTRVEKIERKGAGVVLQTADLDCRARFLVAATGRNGRHFGETARHVEQKHSKFMGIKTHFQGTSLVENEVQLFPYEGGYCGVVRVEGETVNACALVDYKRSRGKNPAQIWKSLLAENGELKRLLGGEIPEFGWLATGNVSFGHFAPMSEDILRAGDAAGYIHPLSGDGMAMAVRSGELVCEAICGSQDAKEAGELYARLWHEEFDRRLKWAAWLQPLMTHRQWTLPALQFFDFAPGLMQKLVTVTRSK